MRFIHLTLHRRHRDVLSKTTMYCVTDRLHDGRAVQVPGHQIAPLVSAWLAELGADSPLVQDLARRRVSATGRQPALWVTSYR